VVQAGGLLFVSGQLPVKQGKIVYSGKVPITIDLPAAREAARLCVVNALAAVKAHLGSLENIEQIVRLEVFVNSAAGFTEQAQVANGASELLYELFGPIGRHARVAVGAAELPLNAAVELAMTLAVK
jgi:enamine deaminase RidA (YjgF/YER057c/UK114 family)